MADLAPVNGRGLPTRTEKATLTLAGLIHTIEEEIGGREALVATLQLVTPRTADLANLINLLADPTEKAPLLALCDANHVTPADLLHLYQEGLTARARVRSVKIIAEKLAPVVDDVMTRAAPFEAPCEACDGIGTVTADPSEAEPNPSPAPCEVCGGAGRLVYAPDLDRQKVALTLGGLLKAGAGVQITLTQQQAALQGLVSGHGPSPFERVQEAIDQVLRGGTPHYAEAEVVEDADPPDQEGSHP